MSGAVREVVPDVLADGLAITVRETLEGTAHAKRYTLRLVGRALAVRAESLDGPRPAYGAYAGLTAGDLEGSGAADGVSVRLPYMDAVPITMLTDPFRGRTWFVSTLLDLPASHANALAPRGPGAGPGSFTNEVMAVYDADADGEVRPVDETLWVTVSPDVEDTFAVPSGPPSPRRAEASGRALVTLAGPPAGPSFRDAAAYLERLRGWRVTDLLVHVPAWADPSAVPPAQGPPDPAAGGAAGFRALASAAGGAVAPSVAYTATVSGCAASTRYRAADRVGGADGDPKGLGAFACPDGGTGAAYLLAPDAAFRFALADAATLGALGARGAFVESLPTWNPAYPWPGAEANALDLAAPPSHPATIGEAVAATKRLLAGLQGSLGPTLGAGAYGPWEWGADSLYAGYLDGASRSLSTGSAERLAGADYLVVPDYELAVARPRLVGFGMGPYERFFGDPALGAHGAGRRLTEAELDAWRATALCYGHAGAWATTATDASALSPAEEVKEYFLMGALASRAVDAPLGSVRYVAADDSHVGLGAALAANFDLVSPRVVIDYPGRLTLWINHAEGDWVVRLGAEAYRLARHGWLASGPEGVLGYSAQVEGRRVDYLWTPELVLVDGRGQLTSFGSLAARDLEVRFSDGARLVEAPDGSLSLQP